MFAGDQDWGDKMIQCKDCEFCQIEPDGRRNFTCDPFANVKEPECIAKWQLIRLDMLLASHQGMLKWQGKLAPLQDKIIKYMQREINELDETENWKLDVDEDEDEGEGEGQEEAF
ncbi:MAG: hypothetical protein CEE38_09095 [Planctomycetes bacterium B3_Pla]|nr:MAG: hypothetical protein CEE38_09095 [Planctomycetes bacterium B3_Pla]